MFNIFRPKKLRRGNLVEVVLTPDAKVHMDGYDWYFPDSTKQTNIPDRLLSGYVVAIEDYCLDLTQVWNKPENKPGTGKISRIYRDAVESYIKK